MAQHQRRPLLAAHDAQVPPSADCGRWSTFIPGRRREDDTFSLDASGARITKRRPVRCGDTGGVGAGRGRRTMRVGWRKVTPGPPQLPRHNRRANRARRKTKVRRAASSDRASASRAERADAQPAATEDVTRRTLACRRVARRRGAPAGNYSPRRPRDDSGAPVASAPSGGWPADRAGTSCKRQLHRHDAASYTAVPDRLSDLGRGHCP